jgi:hypothetical protein
VALTLCNSAFETYARFGSRAEMVTSSRFGPVVLRQPNSYCIRAEVRSRAEAVIPRIEAGRHLASLLGVLSPGQEMGS